MLNSKRHKTQAAAPPYSELMTDTPLPRPPRLPTYFISHGGGPWPWMQDRTHGSYDALTAALQAIRATLAVQPTAVLMVSAHWEAPEFTVMSTPHPGLIYDYGGFPAHTYQIQYPAPGAPALAARVQALLQQAGIAVAPDARRGLDHGAFVPMAVMYPEARMPVLQLSLQHGYDPQAHLALGAALQALRDEGVLIVGSGLSYHNLRALGSAGVAPSAAFDAWLQDTLCHSPPHERAQRLRDWAQAPGARQAHPQEDHLLPLMVAVGAAGDDPAQCIHHESTFFGGITVSSFRFGDTPVQQADAHPGA